MMSLSARPPKIAGLALGLLTALALRPGAGRADPLAGSLADPVRLQDGARAVASPVVFQPAASPQTDAATRSPLNLPALLALNLILPPPQGQQVTSVSDPIIILPPGPTGAATTTQTNPPPTNPPPANPPPTNPPPANPPPTNPPPTNPPPGGSVTPPNPPPVTTSATPEPASLVLGLMGVSGVSLVSWARRRKNGKEKA